MTDNEIFCVILLAGIPILFAILMAFILTWQQIGFLKKDNKHYCERLEESKATIYKLESRIRELEYDVKRIGK